MAQKRSDPTAEWLTAAVCGAVILLAWVLVPTTESVALWGREVPVTCTSRLLFGIECFGCGLTRSFAFMADGQVGLAWEMNHLGPALFLLFASQVPWRTVKALRAHRRRAVVH